MSHRITLEPVVILHRRPFSNTSLIVELFSEQYGRVSALARSARGPKSRFRGVLQLFTPMLVSWMGRNELKTLTQVELTGSSFSLMNEALMCGFYVNELLMYLLHRDDPYPKLFDLYQQTLKRLALESNLPAILRQFEIRLLTELGYGLSLQADAQTGELIDPAARYQYIPEKGFLRCHHELDDVLILSGKTLLDLQREDFTHETTLRESKRLMRIILARHLGDKSLKSRDLLR